MEVIELTPREKEILTFLVEGKTNQQIADDLKLSSDTVKSHLQNINNKMRTGNRTEAVMLAIKLGIITIKAG
jgi:NarL family two-component system response regulator LiaR